MRSRWLILAKFFFFCLFMDQDGDKVHKRTRDTCRVTGVENEGTGDLKLNDSPGLYLYAPCNGELAWM